MGDGSVKQRWNVLENIILWNYGCDPLIIADICKLFVDP